MKHTAKIEKPNSKEKIIKGIFDYSNGVLNFTCTNQNVTFTEAREGLIKLKEEIQRQLDNQEKCPFHEK